MLADAIRATPLRQWVKRSIYPIWPSLRIGVLQPF